jgi:hypothetical protein
MQSARALPWQGEGHWQYIPDCSHGSPSLGSVAGHDGKHGRVIVTHLPFVQYPDVSSQ